MFVDARTLSVDESLASDICIVGSGMAGITIATALSGTGRRVLLVESGGFDSDPAIQALNDGESAGLGYRINESRIRYFGGSGNEWAGNCRELDAANFEHRSWVPHSGWPFTRSALDGYYEKARLFCGVAQETAEVADLRAEGAIPVPWSEPIETAVWQVSSIKPFGARFRSRLADAPGITVLLNANLTQFVNANQGRSIALARFATLAGTHFTVASRHYVLACGGIENARLLLAMVSEQHPKGLGNKYDLVGRFFTEHPEIPIGALVHNRPALPGLGRGGWTGAERVLEGFRLTDNIQKKTQIADVAFWPLYTASVESSPDLVGELGLLLQDVSSRLAQLSPGGSRIQTVLNVTIEQSPNPDSRITLSDKCDELGIRRPRLDWRLNDLDRRTFATALKVIAREAGRQCIGRFWLRMPLRNLNLDCTDSIRFDIPLSSSSTAHNQLDSELRWGCHHMGTTRMHIDPRRGVVDSQCRVHDISNLFIAGSSIFPSVGVSNPTLTIIALALRLADQLAATTW
jgi:choline dehydrogenase-like flavoprotein